MPTSTRKAKSLKHQANRAKQRSIPKKYVPVVKGLVGEGHAFHDVAAFFGTTSGVIARIAFGHDFADVRALRLPKLPVLKLADIVYVSKRLDAAIKMLDQGETVAAREAIVRASEVVNTPSMR